MIKTKKRAENSKPRLKNTIDSAVEEHITKIVKKQSKKEIKQSIDAVVKKEKPKKKEVKEKTKIKKTKNTKEVYGKHSRKEEYQSLQGTGIYDQIKFSPFSGFLYRSNIKANSEFYEHLEIDRIKSQRDELGEHNLVSSEVMQEYAKKTTMNTLLGEGLMGIGGMNPVSVEEKELMNFQMYDPTQKQIYLAELGLLGFNGSRVMHAQID